MVNEGSTPPVDALRVFTGSYHDMVDFYKDTDEELYDALDGPPGPVCRRRSKEWDEDPALSGIELRFDAVLRQERLAELFAICRKRWDPEYPPFRKKLHALAREMSEADLAMLFNVTSAQIHATLQRKV